MILKILLCECWVRFPCTLHPVPFSIGKLHCLSWVVLKPNSAFLFSFLFPSKIIGWSQFFTLSSVDFLFNVIFQFLSSSGGVYFPSLGLDCPFDLLVSIECEELNVYNASSKLSPKRTWTLQPSLSLPSHFPGNKNRLACWKTRGHLEQSPVSSVVPFKVPEKVYHSQQSHPADLKVTWLSLTSRTTQPFQWLLREGGNDTCKPLSFGVVCYMAISNMQPLWLISNSKLWHAPWYNAWMWAGIFYS